MENELKTIAWIKGLGRIVEACSDFHTELLQLKENKAKLITPRDEAYARLQTKGRKNIGKEYGTGTTAGFEYAKEELPILRLNSRLTSPKLARLVVEANGKGNYFHTESTREYEESLKQAEKDKNKEPEQRSIIILPSRDTFTISDKENWDVYQAVLKDQAKPYFELNGPITVYPVDKNIVNAQDGTLLTQLGFGGLDGCSGFGGYCRDLYRGYRARGVRKIAEGVAKNLPYTNKDIRIAEKELRELSRFLQPETYQGIRSLVEKLKR